MSRWFGYSQDVHVILLGNLTVAFVCVYYPILHYCPVPVPVLLRAVPISDDAGIYS